MDCVVDGCFQERFYSDGLCPMHWQRMQRLGSTELPIRACILGRFLDKIDVGESECWLWTGCLNNQGYGVFRVEDENIYSHRFSYELFNGPVPDGLVLDHLCRTPRCVNPNHLEAITQHENVLRGRWTQRTHCVNGHEFTEENTYIRKGGSRVCRKCRNIRSYLAQKKRKKGK